MPASNRPIGPDGFEALYRRESDPWRTWTSSFEAYKRRMLIAACGAGGYGRVLELGCGAGANTAELARRALRVEAVDASPAAIAEARRRLGEDPKIAFQVARLPSGGHGGPYDLIVIAEVAYYLTVSDIGRLCADLARRVKPGGRIVLLHHHIAFSDAAQPPALVHGAICRHLPAEFRRRRRLRTRRWELIELRRVAALRPANG